MLIDFTIRFGHSCFVNEAQVNISYIAMFIVSQLLDHLKTVIVPDTVVEVVVNFHKMFFIPVNLYVSLNTADWTSTDQK